VSAPDPRLGEIEARKVTTELEGIRARATAYRIWGTHGRHAPQDRAFLLTELRKRDEVIARVEALAEMWHKRGESDMAYSKTIPDEDIAMAILTDGAARVENARHIRNAIRAAVTAAKGDGDRG